MKKVDITVSVMNKIVRFEKRETARWLRRYALFIAVFAALFLVAIGVAIRLFYERGTYDPLTLFFEDREIIAEFWRDTLRVLIEELPQRALLSASIALIVIAGVIVMTRRKRTIIRRKLRELAKY